jgi:TonB family protein
MNPTMQPALRGGEMVDSEIVLQRKTRRWFRAGAMVLIFILSVPLVAGAERAIKSRIAPVYPEVAKKLHIEGLVKVEATVDSDGKVVDVKTLSGNHLLATAAEEAVKKWRFATGDGEDKVAVDVDFSLDH